MKLHMLLMQNYIATSSYCLFTYSLIFVSVFQGKRGRRSPFLFSVKIQITTRDYSPQRSLIAYLDRWESETFQCTRHCVSVYLYFIFKTKGCLVELYACDLRMTCSTEWTWTWRATLPARGRHTIHLGERCRSLYGTSLRCGKSDAATGLGLSI